VDQKDYASAAEAVAFYQSIEPEGFEEAREATLFLCRCILLCQQDRELDVAERERLARSYADRAIGALQTAVNEGFRDLGELKTSHAYESIRGRSDFSALVKQVGEIAETVVGGAAR
jgi:hypothetical protein